MPHQGYSTANSYPHQYNVGAPDCRKWWLYAPAKCYRMLTQAKKPGVHPELALYPDFPGFTVPFLEWLFDRHDTNKDGVLQRDEFQAAQSHEAKTGGPFAFWKRVCHNCKPLLLRGATAILRRTPWATAIAPILWPPMLRALIARG